MAGQGGLEDDMMSEISGSRYGGMSRMGTGMSHNRGNSMSRQGSVASGVGNKLGRRMSGLMGLKAKLG